MAKICSSKRELHLQEQSRHPDSKALDSEGVQQGDGRGEEAFGYELPTRDSVAKEEVCRAPVAATVGLGDSNLLPKKEPRNEDERHRLPTSRS